MTPRTLIQLLSSISPENMDKDIWIDGDGYLEAVKDRKHGVVFSVFPGYSTEEQRKESAPSRSHE